MENFKNRRFHPASLLVLPLMVGMIWLYSHTLSGFTVHNGGPEKIAVVPLGRTVNGTLSQISFVAMQLPSRSIALPAGWSTHFSYYKAGVAPSELVVFDGSGKTYSMPVKMGTDFVEIKVADLSPLPPDSQSLPLALKPNHKFQVLLLFIIPSVLSLPLFWLSFRAMRTTRPATWPTLPGA